MVDLQVLRQLDATLNKLKPLSAVSPPPRGWISAIRAALGMNDHQLAARMNVTVDDVSAIQRDEINGHASLATLERAAAALNCRLVYAVIPAETLEQVLLKRAREVATARVEYVNHQMMLEGQQLTGEPLERLVQDEINDLLSEPSAVWDVPK